LKFSLLVCLLIYLVSCSSDPAQGTPDYSKEFKTGCKVKVLQTGRDALLHRIGLLRSAKKSIVLQTFIWADDESGRMLIYEMIKAAQRGVKVKLLCDHLFTHQNVQSMAAILNIKGLEIKIYNPAGEDISPSALRLFGQTASNFKKIKQRMHNKLMLVDSQNAICGGRNIEDTYYDNAVGMNFKDLDLAVSGPVCKEMQKSFEEFWNSPLCVSLSSFKDVEEELKKETRLDVNLDENILFQVLRDEIRDYDWRSGYFEVDKMAFFSDKPGKNDTSSFKGSGRLNDFIVHTIDNAQSKIWVQSPYLVFSDKAKKLFNKWRDLKKNLDIRISTNSLVATDSWPTYAFYYKQKKMLIEDLGIKIFEFNPLPGDLRKYVPAYSDLLNKMSLSSLSEDERKSGNIKKYPRLCLHSKCLLVDDNISFVGSYNLDPRSANLNTEVSVVIIDKKFNGIMADILKQDMKAKNSWVVAKRQKMVGLKQLESLVSMISGIGAKISGIDLWPRRFTSCFQLREGAEEVSPEHEDFYKNYIQVGNFPRMPWFGEKEIFTRLFKVFASSLKPIL
jgi:phosphatidylserine/phosphatidylglycerophosphate/cardiolipin synthase-like enzyme